jgi:hypothetical protein
LTSRFGGIHVSRNIGVVHGTLLEDTDAVVIRANSVVGVVEGGRDTPISINQDV